MLTVPTLAIARNPTPMSYQSQPPYSSERMLASRYVTGFHLATAWSQPLSASSGRNDVVRNMNGKNRMKLVFTAAGFPVLSAIAYGNPVNARPHSPAIKMKISDPGEPGLEAHADDVSHEDHGDRQRDDQDEVGHHQPEQQ